MENGELPFLSDEALDAMMETLVAMGAEPLPEADDAVNDKLPEGHAGADDANDALPNTVCSFDSLSALSMVLFWNGILCGPYVRCEDAIFIRDYFDVNQVESPAPKPQQLTDFAQYFHLPGDVVAKKLSMPRDGFTKFYKEFGVSKWPYQTVSLTFRHINWYSRPEFVLIHACDILFEFCETWPLR